VEFRKIMILISSPTALMLQECNRFCLSVAECIHSSVCFHSILASRSIGQRPRSKVLMLLSHRAPLCQWLETTLKSLSHLHTLVLISSEHDIRIHIAIAHNCMASLDYDYIWHSSITLPTKLRLYRVFILPVILYGAETWSPT